MLRFPAWSAVLSALLFSPVSLAQSKATAHPPAASSAGNPYKNEAMVWEHFDTTSRMQADGTGERIVHIVVRLQSEGAARSFSVLSVPYASACESAVVDYVRVLKPDGSIVKTDTADAIEMPAAVTREAPLYSDLKEMQLPVRDIAAEDVLDYQFHVSRIKAEVPGQFWGSEHFMVTGGVVLSQTVTLEVPAQKYIQVWDPHHPATPVEKNGVLTYTWNSSQLKPTSKAKDPSAAVDTKETKAPDDDIKDQDEDTDGRALPSVAWTTFHNWAEVGDWYRGLAHDRTDPTPTIQAKANALTASAATPEA